MSFAEIVGHQQQIEFLRRVAGGQRLAHSLLLAGPPGIGKRLVADALTALLLCEEPANGDACGRCPSCRQLGASTHPDVLVVTLPKDKREIPIEKARELNAFLRLQPLRGGRKVAIVDDSQLMNAAAQNALLKGLEEPPPNSLAILVAHNADALLPTIRSRCQRLLFAPLGDADVRAILERRGVPAAEANTLVEIADGSAGRALRLRGTVAAGAAPRLADLSSARYGALVQIAAALAESEEKASVGLEALLRSCHAEAVDEVRAGETDRAAAAAEAAASIAEALANLRRRSANRQLLLESTLLQVAKRYARGRGA